MDMEEANKIINRDLRRYKENLIEEFKSAELNLTLIIEKERKILKVNNLPKHFSNIIIYLRLN
jgi:hypothetical protein